MTNAAMNLVEASPRERRVSQFELESATTQKYLDDLETTLRTLHAKLDPVLRPDPRHADAECRNTASPAQPAVCGIASIQREFNRRLCETLSYAKEVMEQVDL